VVLGVVGHRDGLVAGERPDHDVGVELLHQAAGLLDRRVRGVVAAAHADELERVVADRAAGPAVTRLVPGLRLRARELRHRRDDAGHVLVVERAERALALREDGDLDRRAGTTAARLDGRLRVRTFDSGSGSAACVLVGSSDLAPPPPSFSSSPQPATTSAPPASNTASHADPRPPSSTDLICLSPPPVPR
jgi:hypothetical protein